MKEEYEIKNSPYVVELSEYIEQVLTEVPDRRNRTNYNVWKKEINYLIERINKLAKHPLYSLVK